MLSSMKRADGDAKLILVRLAIFGPPFGPSHFMGSATCLKDGALFGGTKYPSKASQGGLNEPWLEGHSCSLTVAIEFPGLRCAGRERGR